MNWDKEVEERFNSIYDQVQPLRGKIANSIDPRRLNMDPCDIASWVDCKILYVFQKYHERFDDDEALKAHILSSMNTLIKKIAKVSDGKKNAFRDNFIKVEDKSRIYDLRLDDQRNLEETQELLSNVMSEFKSRLSEDAWIYFSCTLNIPPYVTDRMVEMGKKSFKRVPKELWIEFLGWEDNPKKINKVKSEIRNITQYIKEKEDINM